VIKIIPAVDIKGGKVVRLTQGLADKETVYSDSPVEVAEKWDSMGAELIHIVDLDGAFEGRLRNLVIVKKIAAKVRSKLELGGGIRDEDTIKKVIDCGVDKVVIGTRALDERFLDRIAKTFKDKIVAGIDAEDGIVRTKGWLFKTKTSAVDLAQKIEKSGIGRINYTDISKDGMLGGPNIDSLKEILDKTYLDVVASGGISTIDDVKRLRQFEDEGLVGIIIGKALYENKIDLGEAIKICSQRG